MNSVCLDYEKVDFLANLLIPTLARHPISNSFPERGLALKEKHPELVGWPERKLGEVENYQNALSRQLPSLNSPSSAVRPGTRITGITSTNISLTANNNPPHPNPLPRGEGTARCSYSPSPFGRGAG